MMWVFSLSGCHGKRWARTHDDDHVGDDGVAQDGGHTPAYRLTETLLCEQASSEGGKKFGDRKRDSVSEASPRHQTALGSSCSPRDYTALD